MQKIILLREGIFHFFSIFSEADFLHINLFFEFIFKLEPSPYQKTFLLLILT
jgi:hypothetical protein